MTYFHFMVVLFVFNNQKIYISCLCLDYFLLHKLFYCLFLCLFASSVWLGWSLHRLNQYRICKELETYINLDIHVLRPKETETLVFGENYRNDRVQFLKIPGIHAHNLRGWLYRAGKHLHKSRDQGFDFIITSVVVRSPRENHYCCYTCIMYNAL